MAVPRAGDEAEIRRHIDGMAHAIQTMDLEGLKETEVDFKSGKALLDLTP